MGGTGFERIDPDDWPVPSEEQINEIGALTEAMLRLAEDKDAQLFGTALMYVAAIIVKTQYPDAERGATDGLCSLLRVLIERGVVTAGVTSSTPTVGNA